MQTKNLYKINNKSNGVGVVRMYVTTWVTNKLQMNPVQLLQFLPNLQNWTSINQLFQAQLASSKRIEIWRTLRFKNELWKEHNFEYGSSANVFTIYRKVNRSIPTPSLWVTQESQQINTNSQFMGNGSRYIQTHYAIAFIVNSIHVLVTCA